MSIVSFGIALAVGGYFLGANKNKTAEAPTSQVATPTPDATVYTDKGSANWKTYTNTTYGFSLKYPQDLKVSESKDNFENEVVSFRNDQVDQGCISINVKINPIGSQTIENWIKTNRKQIKPSNEIVIPELHKYVNGDIIGYWIETGSESIGKSILLQNGSRIIEVNTPSCSAGDHYQKHSETLNIMDKMVSTFKFTDSSANVGMGCKIGGCSGQICQNETDEGAITTCEYKEEYACYKTAKCEVQANGKCGWTQTVELTSCLSSN